MRLDPVSLRFFLSVLEEGSIARAAEREHIAASAISKRLAELEGLVGTELFGRSNKGLAPTAAALSLASLARGALLQLDGIVEEMREFATGARGHVRVAANISVITQFLPAELRAFMAAYPDVQVHLQERISSAIARAVAENEADIGLLQGGEYGYPVRMIAYRRDELVVVAPRGHALARRKSVDMREVLRHELVGAHTGSAINASLAASAIRLGVPLKLRMQVTSFDALSLMVAAGLGIGIMPRGSAELLGGPEIRCIRLDEAWAERQLCLAVRDETQLTPSARLLMDHLLQG